MGLVKKSDLAKYWSQKPNIRVPFFGKFMSRNRFQSILWNLHLADDTNNPAHRNIGHDPLAKMRPFVDMIEKNFSRMYRPEKNIAIDEACCPFKGRLHFRVYNPQKPNRFHIKLFQVSESSSGYIVGFEIYTGKDGPTVADNANTMDKHASKTTKIVFGLLDKLKLLNKGHHVYMDNYYTSPELFEELYFCDTYACGTARIRRKGMPKSIGNLEVKALESGYLRNGPLLCLKWRGQKTKNKKKPVTVLSTIHEAREILTMKKDKHGNQIPKPEVIVQYTQHMSGVDLSDQYMAFHTNLRKSMKWWRKLFFHLFNMVLLNSYILNKKFGKTKLSHEDYMEYMADHFLNTSLEGCTCLPKRSTTNNSNKSRLIDRHFIQKIPKKVGSTREPNPICKGCNFTPSQMISLGFEGVQMPRKTTTYWCPKCEIALCIVPCFEIYHTVDQYRHNLLLHRLGDN